MKFHNLFLITNFFLISFGISFGQTDFQLRDPEYLIDQYNQLVAKHNALIEKTRLLIIEQKQSPSSDIEQEERLRQELNEAVAKSSILENELSKIKQEGLRTNTSNQYLDDTNARLRKQLLEIKADEQELLQRSKELTSENRRLENAQKSFDSQEKSNYSKIRNLELGKSTIQRRANDLLAENNTLSAGNQKLKAQVDRLEKEIALSNQKLAGLKIDKETRSSRLSDLEAMLRSKDELNKSLENKETTFQEDINDLRNEMSSINRGGESSQRQK